jgi:hypothetical protein
MANPRTSTPTPPPQPEYRPTEAEIIAKIKNIQKDISYLKKQLIKLQVWAGDCKQLSQFNNGSLLARIVNYDYANLSDAALRERYVWISDKDTQTMNFFMHGYIPSTPNFSSKFAPDFQVKVLKPEDLGNQFQARGPLGWLFPTDVSSTLHLFSNTYLNSLISIFKTNIAGKEIDLQNEQDYYKRLFKKVAPGTLKTTNPKPGTGPATTTTPPVVSTWKDIRKEPTKYNVPSVKESYFQSNLFKAARAGDSGGRTLAEQKPLFESNTPKKVIDAKELWESALGSKGMIQINTQIPSTQQYTITNSDAYNSSSLSPDFNRKYGFQFLYNPSTIEMQYMGIAQTDMTMYTSGTEAFNMIPPSTTSATVSFDILINRMNDMKYYTSEGKLTEHGKNAYPADHVPDATEQKQIYSMGTMYDIEYLLRTLLGYTSKSYLRNGMVTADLGWFSKKPVELHLGKNLRYLGFVGGVSLRHAIFNENMVPLFTTVHIEFSRIPDYPYVDDKTTAKDK